MIFFLPLQCALYYELFEVIIRPEVTLMLKIISLVHSSCCKSYLLLYSLKEFKGAYEHA